MNKLAAADPSKIMGVYVAFLRALYIIHQNNHWQFHGYDTHLLFQRLYEAKQENADGAAEKTVGLFGEKAIDITSQIATIQKLCLKFAEPGGIESSLAMEEEFLKFSKNAYESIKNSGAMTHGLDDLIMSITSKSEEAVYLLRQSIS